MNVAPLALFDVATAEMASPGSPPPAEGFAELLLTVAPASPRNPAESNVVTAVPIVPEAALPPPATTDLAVPMLPAPFARSPRQMLQMPPVNDEAAVSPEASAPAAKDEAPNEVVDAPRPLDPAAFAVAVIVVPSPTSGRTVLPGTAAVARVPPTIEAAVEPRSDAPHRHDRPLEQNDGLPARPVEVAASLPVIQPNFAEPLSPLEADARPTGSDDAKPERTSTPEPVALAVPTRGAVSARVEVSARDAVPTPAAKPTPVVAAAFPPERFAVETQPDQELAPVSPLPETRPGATAATTVLAARSQPAVPAVPVAADVATRTSAPLALGSPPEAVARVAAATTAPRAAEPSALRRSVPRDLAQSIETAFVPPPAQQAIAAEPAATTAVARNSTATPAAEATRLETEALGNVAIALDRRDAALHVHFTVDRTSTAHALLESARLLDGALQSGGTRLEQLSVDVRSSDGRNSTATGSDARNPAPQSDGSGQRAPTRDPRTPDAPRTFLPPSAPRHPRATAQDRFA